MVGSEGVEYTCGVCGSRIPNTTKRQESGAHVLVYHPYGWGTCSPECARAAHIAEAFRDAIRIWRGI